MVTKQTRKDIADLINILETLPMSGIDDTVQVDTEKPVQEFQWDVWMHPMDNTRTPYPFVFEQYVRPIVYSICNFDVLRENGLHWAFIRKYEPEGRIKLDAHFDTTCYTVNIVLSDPSEYEGGEFLFVKNSKTIPEWMSGANGGGAAKLNYISDDLLNLNLEKKIKPEFGEVFVLRGESNRVAPPNLHRVFPVKTGQRYVLCLFFEHPELNDMPNKILKYYNKYNLENGK